MNTITVVAEVEMDDALVEIPSSYLIQHLKKIVSVSRYSRNPTLDIIRELLDLNNVSSKEDIIEKIKEL